MAATFTTGNLNRWPDGAVLAPPPSASPWQWHRNAGAVLPVVLWFGNYVQPHILASVNAGLSCPTAWHVRARAEGTVLADAFVGSGDWYGPGTVGTAELWLDELNSPAWNDTVSRRVQGIHFDFSLDGGESWSYFGTAQPTCWYVMPGGDALPSGHLRYDLALNKVAQYASGISSESAIAGAVNSGIAGELIYDPGINGVVPHDKHVLYAYEQGRALCKYNALLLEYLGEAAGIDAYVRYLWSGAFSTRADFYQHAGPGNWVSFRAVCEAEDGVPPNPHFKYHAQTIINGTWYDPSYGTIGQTVFSEVCPSYSESALCEAHYPPDPNEPLRTPVQQQGGHWPPTGSPWYILVPYMCSCP